MAKFKRQNGKVKASDVSDRTMSGVGLSYEKKPGYSMIGYDASGQPVYSNDKLSKSIDEDVGKTKIGFISNMLKNIGVTNEKDLQMFNAIGDSASDKKFLSKLYTLKKDGDTKGFINLISKTLKTPIAKRFNDPQNQAGVEGAFQAFNLYNNWDNMSRAQRSLGVAQLGLDTYEFADGTRLSDKQVFGPIQKDGKTIIPGLTVGQTLGLAANGVDVYETVKNWKDLSALAKVTNGAQSVSTIINTAQTLGMFGDSDQPTDPKNPRLANSPKGTTPAGAFSAIGTYGNMGVAGVGVAAGVGTVVTAFTDKNATDKQKQDAMITGTQLAVNNLAKLGNDTAGDVAPYVNGVAAGKRLYDVYNDPNSTDQQKTDATLNATKEGVNIAAQLGSESAGEAVPYVNYAMAAYNASRILGSDASDKDKAVALRRAGEDAVASYFTFGLSNVAQYADRQFLGGQGDKLREMHDKINPGTIVTDKVGAEIIGGISAVTAGKSQDQSSRDLVRKHFKGKLYGDEFTIENPDGTVGNVGVDGKGGMHKWADKNRVVSGTNADDLHSYDVDYTNDMDYAASMGGITLARLGTGRSAKNIDQFGGQLGNASLGSVGYGAEFTEDNFNKVMQNQRAMYANAGITDRETFNEYLEANKKNFSAAEYAVAQQSAEMLYGKDGYALSKKLMAGRWAGIQTVADINSAKEEQEAKKVQPKGAAPLPSDTQVQPEV